MAINKLLLEKKLDENPFSDSVGAVSVGIFQDNAILDLDYIEDKDADVDFNIVMTGSGKFVELQAMGEEATFEQSQLDELLSLAKQGITELTNHQKKAILAL